ncbi:hypothetical protein BpHYR1_002661 [Brachionus plicatilis]|uniref:Uncharacterized protein n=1 Tax=Brachionus plicatilis TaxID=10195 RepID=A0A3M7RM11_BRAPC|nr:hypothetical protein BpHYR1_002661 [Brachionus plicatilis]
MLRLKIYPKTYIGKKNFKCIYVLLPYTRVLDSFYLTKVDSLIGLTALEYDYALMKFYVFDQTECDLVQIDYDKLD